MKLQIIYTFYIADDYCNNDIYKLHYYWINHISYVVDKLTFILMYNGKINDDIIYRVKSKLINICNSKEVQFIMEPNNSNYREGLYYKKYIIDKINDYDDYLTFFAHTKGVTNQDGLNNLDNLYLWITSLYYLNFNWLSEVKSKLSNYNSYDLSKNYITFGGLYFKDYRHNNVHNWFYSGSFHWLNTKKLKEYINTNKINIDAFICDEGERLKRCAELFIGSCLPIDYVAFHNDENINKEYEAFNSRGWEVSYTEINLFLSNTLNAFEYNDLYQEHNKILSELNII